MAVTSSPLSGSASCPSLRKAGRNGGLGASLRRRAERPSSAGSCRSAVPSTSSTCSVGRSAARVEALRAEVLGARDERMPADSKQSCTSPAFARKQSRQTSQSRNSRRSSHCAWSEQLRRRTGTGLDISIMSELSKNNYSGEQLHQGIATGSPYNWEHLHRGTASGSAYSYLRLFGLGQYANTLGIHAGMDELEYLSRLPEAQVLDLLESVQLLPGHRAKMLTALSMLRQASHLGKGSQFNGELCDKQTLDQLCDRMDLLLRERDESDKQNQILQKENHHLLLALRQQTSESNVELALAQKRTVDLERLVSDQSEHVNFLAERLQQVLGPEPMNSEKLYLVGSSQACNLVAPMASEPEKSVGSEALTMDADTMTRARACNVSTTPRPPLSPAKSVAHTSEINAEFMMLAFQPFERGDRVKSLLSFKDVYSAGDEGIVTKLEDCDGISHCQVTWDRSGKCSGFQTANWSAFVERVDKAATSANNLAAVSSATVDESLAIKLIGANNVAALASASADGSLAIKMAGANNVAALASASVDGSLVSNLAGASNVAALASASADGSLATELAAANNVAALASTSVDGSLATKLAGTNSVAAFASATADGSLAAKLAGANNIAALANASVDGSLVTQLAGEASGAPEASAAPPMPSASWRRKPPGGMTVPENLQVADHAARCLAIAIRNKLMLCTALGATDDELCMDVLFYEPSSEASIQAGLSATSTSLPSQDAIYDIVHEFVEVAQLPAEVVVIALTYLDRLQGGSNSAACTSASKRSGARLTPSNWRRLVFASLLLARTSLQKEEPLDLAKLAPLVPGFAGEELQRFEEALLEALAWDASVSASEYAKTCLLLQTLGAKDLPDARLPQRFGDERALHLAERGASKSKWHHPDQCGIRP